MANSFSISDKQEIAANLVQILSNASALATIQITDLPAIEDKIDVIDTEVGVIHSNDIPGTNAKIDVNLAAIDIIDGIVDAIKLKTDLIPQNVRGDFFNTYLATTSGTYVDLVNITGAGKLRDFCLWLSDDADTIQIQVTIDGKPSDEPTFTGSTAVQSVIFDRSTTVNPNISIEADLKATLGYDILNLEFSTSLLIQIKRSAGTTGDVIALAVYSLDTF